MGSACFARNGIATVEAAVPSSLLPDLEELKEFSNGGRPGQRSFSIAPAVDSLIKSGGLLADLAARMVGQPTRPVRVLYFDKKPNANWAVPWHQDRTIAVAHRVDAQGYETWSVKGGIPHVEPPESVLASMISLRLHIDDCNHDNGPLLALRGSFRLGRVASGDIKGYVDAGDIEVCCVKAGDVVAMRGLTIHASERALRPSNRRVVHVDFSSASLPNGLEWALPYPFS